MPRAIPEAPENITELDMSDYLTTEQVARGFGRTTMTIYTWRTAKGLPYTVIKAAQKDTIRFKIGDVKKWAKEVGIPFDINAVDVCESA